MCVCDSTQTDAVLQAYLVPRHQLLPGLLNGQASVTTLSYLPVLPVLRGQAGYPKHAERMQPHLQFTGLGDFLVELRTRSVLTVHSLAVQPNGPREGCLCMCVCVSTECE